MDGEIPPWKSHASSTRMKIQSIPLLNIGKPTVYKEQILTILQSAGISAADAYVCIKAIKKKKADKVASFRERFETGFTKMLKEEEGSSDAEAADIVDKIWTIINDAASYMF